MINRPTYEELEKKIADLDAQQKNQRNAEAEFTKSQAALNSIIAAAPMGIGLIAENRVLLWVNDKLCEMTGYKKEELQGKSARILYPSEEEFFRVGKERYNQISRQGQGIIETCFLHKNKELVYVLLSSVPINPENISEGITFTALDISEPRKVLEEQKELIALIEHSKDFIGISTAEGKALHINKAGLDLCGLQHEFKSPCCFIFNADPKNSIAVIHDNILPHVLSEGSWSGEGHVRNLATGNLSPVDISVFTISGGSPGSPVRMGTIMRDISDRNQMENEKQELQLQLIKTQKMEAIGVLAGGIAHDFNNILLPILGYTELLLETPDIDPSSHEILNQILQAAKRARGLVKQILTFSRQENNEIKPVDMGVILREVIKLVRSSLPATIEVQQYISKQCGLVMADPSQIHQIAMNLVTNAFHAMEKTGGQLSIKLMDVHIDHGTSIGDLIVNPGRYACFAVSDTGIGMEQQILDRIFDPYFTTKKKGKGTGLGLSVVHGIVKSFGGYIRSESTPGKGSVFEVFLPTISVPESIKDPSSTEHQFKRGSEKVLLVDDESQIIQMETQRLEYLGYQVTSRTNPNDALELFEKDPDYFDLIITDMTMPKMTGGELSGKIREIKPDMPIIICTGYSEKVNADTIKEMNIQGFIQKPILLGEISNLIRKVLDKK